MRKLLTILVLTASIGVASSVCAQDFEKGRSAEAIGEHELALKEFRFLAERGHAEAQNKVGSYYDLGLGVIQNYKEAVTWYRKSSEQGDAFAQYNLGIMYVNGRGVPQDNIYAHMWFNISESVRHSYAATSRDAVAKKMTAADVSKAQELARECVKKQYKGC